MAIYIEDQELEETLVQIASKQEIPTNKRAMAKAILRAVIDDYLDTGDARLWIHRPVQRG